MQDPNPSPMVATTAGRPRHDGVLDVWLRHMERSDTDADATQIAQMCARYQQAQQVRERGRVAGAKERRVLRLGEQAAEQLVEQYWRMLWGQVCAALPASGGTGGTGFANGRDDLDERRQDLLADLHVCLLEAAASFDPERGVEFTSFLVTMLTRRVNDRRDERASELAGVPVIWERVARIAERVRPDLVARNHKEPTIGELRDAVRTYCLRWASERILEDHPDLAQEELEDRARRKLVRQGTWAAIEQLGEVLETRRAALRLDLPTREDGATLLERQAATSEQTPASERVLCLLEAQDRRMLEMRMGAHDGREWRYEEIAEHENLTWPEVRRRIKRATAAVLTPHAHFTRLAPGIEEQFEEGEQTGALERFLSRTLEPARR